MPIRDTIYLDNRPFKKSINEAERDSKNLGKSMGDATNEGARKAEGNFKRIGNAAKLYIAGAAVGAFMALRKAINRGQDIEETASKFDTVLGPAVQRANAYISENARLFGMTTNQMKEAVATTTAISKGFGLTTDNAFDLSTQILNLSGDLQSFNNVPFEQTQRAIVSALTGEREALKTLGIVINEEMVRQQAMTQFRLEDAKAVTQQHKAMATLTLIAQKSADAIGDLERTQNSSANRMRQALAQMNEILDTLSTKLNQSFGPNLIKWITNGLTQAEKLVDTLNRAVSSDLENLITNLEAQGGDQELISRLRVQVNREQKRQLRQEIEEELSQITVPQAVVEKNFTDKIKGIFATLRGTLSGSIVEDLTGGESGPIATVQAIVAEMNNEFKSVGDGFDPEKIDQYNFRVRQLEKELKNVTAAAAAASEQGLTDQASELTQYANAISDAISQINIVLGKAEQLRLLAEDTTATVNTTQATETPSAFGSGIGAVSAEEFRKQVVQPVEELLDSLVQVGKISPQAARSYIKGMKAAGAQTEDTAESAEDLLDSMHGVADAVSGIISLADSFEVLSQEMRAALRGSVDLLRNIENLKKARATAGAGFMDFAVPGIGIAASSIAILQSTLLPLFRNQGQEQMNAQELQELQFSIEENRRALERNTKALLEQAVVGQNLNQDIVDSLRAAFEQAVSTAGRYFLPDADARQSLNALQLALDAAGIDADLLGNFDEFVESGLSNSEALQRVLGLFSQGFGMDLGVTEGGLADLIQSIIDGFGAFSDTLQGAIEQFRLSIDLGGVSLQDALTTFTARVRDLGTGIPEEILSQIEGLDLDTDAGREALDAIIADLFAGRGDFMGDLSPDEFTDLLNFLEGLTRNGSGATGEVVRSVSGVAGITEFQATDINMLLEAQLFEAGRQTDLLGDILAHMMGGRDSGLSRVPDPPPTMSASSINLGGVSVNAPMSDQQIMSITNQIANELKRLRQGGQFG